MAVSSKQYVDVHYGTGQEDDYTTKELCATNCGIQNCRPRHSFGPGSKSAHSLHFVLSGKGEFHNQDDKQTLRRGDIFLLKRGEKVFYQADGQDPWSYAWVEFAGEKAETYLSYAGFPPHSSVQHSLVPNETYLQIVEEIIQNREATVTNELARTGLLYRLLAILTEAQRLAASGGKGNYDYPREVYVEYAKDFIHRYYPNISISDIARHIGVNRSYLTMIFNKVTGISPKEYLLRCRMERAQELLRTTDSTLGEIAELVGYKDPFTFSKIFKARYGDPPSVYRKQYPEKSVGSFPPPPVAQGPTMERLDPTGEAEYRATSNFRVLERLPNCNNYLILTHCGEEQCAPGHSYAEVREEFHMHFILAGKGTFRVGNALYRLGRGDIFVVPAGENNYYQADYDDPWHYCWAAFKGKSARFFLAEAGLTSANLARPAYAPVEQFHAQILRMLELRALTFANELRRMEELYAMLSLLIRSRLPGGDADGKLPRYSRDRHVNHAVQYIQSNFCSARIADVAGYVGLHRSYLTTLFKKELGISPQEYLIRFRMEKAADLLQSTRMRIAEIATAVGYEDPLSFTKVFRRHYGQSPGAFRSAQSLAGE